MSSLDVTQVPGLETLRSGVRVEADRQFVRFYGGRFDGRHRWPDYTRFIEPTLEIWERERIYRLWVRTLNGPPASRGARSSPAGWSPGADTGTAT